MLSRNFRLQKVGDFDWLKNNYDFSKISFSIDELIVLDVTRGPKDPKAFALTLSQLAEKCFVPIAAGGGIRKFNQAKDLLRSGADKIVVNSGLFNDSSLVSELSSEFGAQAIIASIDFKIINDRYCVFISNGDELIPLDIDSVLRKIATLPIGEIYLNSMLQDGTGQGLDLSVIKRIPKEIQLPVILAGGVGNSHHLIQGLMINEVDAVATANLFNFVGDGLTVARNEVIKSGIKLPIWKQNIPFHDNYDGRG
jgi:cyclase